MRHLPIFLMALLAVGCHLKTAQPGGKDSMVKLSEQDRMIQHVDEALAKVQFEPTPCLDPGKVQGVVKRCFVFHGDPERHLATLSEQLGRLGIKKMQWRQDFGMWASTYELAGDQTYDLILSLIAKGLDPVLSVEPKLKAYDGYAWYSLAPK